MILQETTKEIGGKLGKHDKAIERHDKAWIDLNYPLVLKKNQNNLFNKCLRWI